MLIKFETKSARVKNLAFHPRRRWILASLHSGVIQLWDYNEKTMIDKYDEHKGPVRGLDFHKQQPLFVSGGDDTKIRVWNYKHRRCLFTLEAHDDYIRSTYFHHEYPWILSSSDDQTVRIWNWQSRTKVAVLTGHTHYVMCAQFHPKLDLIVSASIDQTLRVWDISGLKRKSVRSTTEEIGGMPTILSKTDYDVKQIDAHNSEINWCCFHQNPDRQYMLSAGDDNYVKIWRMDPYREIDTFRGHYNNVNCAIFHPRKNLVISASEDKSIRVWDLDKRSALNTFRKEIERFWILAAHPKENLFAAGHDTGIMLFKLERERPPFVLFEDSVLYIYGNQVFQYKMKIEGKPAQPKVMSTLRTKPEITHYYHRLDYRDEQLLVTIRSSNVEKSIYDLYKLTERNSFDKAPESVRSQGLTSMFIGRNKIAVLDKSKKVIFKSTTSNQERKLKFTITADEIYSAGVGKIYVREGEELSLWDLEEGAVIKSVKVKAKFIVVSDDKKYIACAGSSKITICDHDLNILSIVQEQRKIKSAAWEEGGVLFYNTPVQIKYALTDGYTTTVMSVESTLYILAVKEGRIFYIDRSGDVHRIIVDPTEYKFKQAVIDGDRPAILSFIRKLKNLNQSQIAFLVEKNYPELALNSVKDHRIRFLLACKAFKIEEALKSAEILKDDRCWEQLAEAALNIGKGSIAEIAYKRMKRPYKLAMLYLPCKQKSKLLEARNLAKEVDDMSTEFMISLLLKDFEGCAKVMLEGVHPNLAYVCAVNHGLPDLANQIRDRLTPEQRKKLPDIDTKRESWMKRTIPDIKNPIDLDWPLIPLEGDSADEQLSSFSDSDEESVHELPKEETVVEQEEEVPEEEEEVEEEDEPLEDWNWAE